MLNLMVNLIYLGSVCEKCFIINILKVVIFIGIKFNVNISCLVLFFNGWLVLYRVLVVFWFK